ACDKTSVAAMIATRRDWRPAWLGDSGAELPEDIVISVSPPRHCVGVIPGDQRRSLGYRQRIEHGVEVAVEHLIEVVGFVAHPVIRNSVLREVVGADTLRTVH